MMGSGSRVKQSQKKEKVLKTRRLSNLAKRNPLYSKQDRIISVVIPAYCAETHLESVVKGIPEFVEHIIIVDDCSPDNTGQVAEQLSRSNNKIKVIRHETNQGVGGAMLSGYELACRLNSTIVVKMDADDQMDPAYLPTLISPILEGQADYTKGNRFLHGRQLKSMPILRQIGNIGLSFLTKLASGYWNVFDPTNGYTAIHTSVAKLMDTANIDRRYFFETSMILELGLLGAVIRDVYIPARYAAETSQLSEWRALLDFPKRLLKGFFRRIWIQYFLRDFNLVSLYLLGGLVLLGFGGLFGAYHWWWSAQLHIATQTGTVMLAVLPIILGVQLLLQVAALDVQNVPNYVIHRSVESVRRADEE
jgi:dolichol-phosphate mannosyltransferase